LTHCSTACWTPTRSDSRKETQIALRYFTSDLHFGHKGVLKYCNRPFANTQEGDRFLINAINNLECDELWVLGDFCLTGSTRAVEIVNQLKPNLTLVRGNHDHDRVVRRLAENGVTILDTHDGIIAGRKVTISHYPFNDSRYPDRSPANNGRVVVHGHIHDIRGVAKNQVNVGWDYWNRFLSEDEVGDLIDKSRNFITETNEI